MQPRHTELSEYVRHHLHGVSFLSIDADKPRLRTNMQSLFMLKPSDSKLKVEFETLLSHAAISEKRCPTAGMLFLKKFALRDLTRQKYEMSKTGMLTALYDAGISRHHRQMLEFVIDNVSVGSRAVVRRSASGRYFIEVVEGHSFKCVSLLKNSQVELVDSYVICIDGYVESVSEIHHMLEFLSERKSSCILFVRGMSDEVLHTLKVNLDRKTVACYPYAVAFDLDSVNSLVDIAVACGSDVTSSLKGNLISSIDMTSQKRVDKLNLYSDSVRIINRSSRKSVDEQIARLREKMKENPDAASVLSQRVRSLSSSCIEVGIPDDMEFYSNSSQIDLGIRIISAFIDGTFEPYDVAEECLSSYKKLIDGTVTLFTE